MIIQKRTYLLGLGEGINVGIAVGVTLGTSPIVAPTIVIWPVQAPELRHPCLTSYVAHGAVLEVVKLSDAHIPHPFCIVLTCVEVPDTVEKTATN